MRSIILVVVSYACLSLMPLLLAEESPPSEPSTTTQVVIEARFVSASPRLLPSLGQETDLIVPPVVEEDSLFDSTSVASNGDTAIQLVSATSIVEERQPIHAVLIDDQQLSNFIKQAQGDRRSNIMHGPKVTVWDRQTADIDSVTLRPFVVDAANKKTELRQVQEGTKLLVRPSVQPSGAVQLDVRFRADQVEGVAVYDKNKEQKVQSPRVKGLKIELSAVVPPGKTLAIWCPEDSSQGVPVESKGLAKLFRRKAFEKEQKTSLVLLMTPKVFAEEDLKEEATISE